MCILRKLTAKGISDFDILTVVVILREICVEKRTKNACHGTHNHTY